jgi:hypothetical protein
MNPTYDQPHPVDPVVERWTPSDEAQFKLLEEKRERIRGTLRAALEEAMSDPIGEVGYCEGSIDGMLDKMIENADAIRLALLPYCKS